MAADIVEIMAALGTRLNGITGLRGYPHPMDDPQPPSAFPLVPSIPSYREAMGRGTYILQFTVALLVPAQLDRVGLPRLIGFVNPTGATSVRVALEDGDKTLGGLVNDLVVDGFDSNGLQDVGYGSYYGGTFQVRVIASGV